MNNNKGTVEKANSILVVRKSKYILRKSIQTKKITVLLKLNKRVQSLFIYRTSGHSPM